MKKKLVAVILSIMICLMGNVALAVDEEIDEPQEKHDITLTADYSNGSRKVNLEWTKVDDDTKLLDVVKVGDYVEYSTNIADINRKCHNLRYSFMVNRRDLYNNNKWKVISVDGDTIQLISTDVVATTSISGENYGWAYKRNPYPFGDDWGDNGGYGLYYQLQKIADCFVREDQATSARVVDIADIEHNQALNDLRKNLGNIQTDNIPVEIIEKAYRDVYDTDKHGAGPNGMGGSRAYTFKVAQITDRNSPYLGGSFFLPNYYNGNNGLNAIYYVEGTKVYLQRVSPYGRSKTSGVKIIITLKNGLYKTGGDGSSVTPWTISTTPVHAPYTVYQKQGENGEYTVKRTNLLNPHTEISQADGFMDLEGPYKPNAELSIIRNDDWNLRLTVHSGDRGTEYYHKVTAYSGKEYTSNETCTIITTGVNGYAYVIDQNEHTDPGNEIMFKEGETIKISRLKMNEGYYLHIKAIDNAGKEGDILDMELKFTFTDLKLYKKYQEASDFDETGVARIPGWNYVDIDWNPMKEDTEEPVVKYQVPDVCFVIDVSGSMSSFVLDMSLLTKEEKETANQLYQEYLEAEKALEDYMEETGYDPRDGPPTPEAEELEAEVNLAYHQYDSFVLKHGGVRRNRLEIVKEGTIELISNLLDRYPEMKISLVTFATNPSIKIEASSNKELIIKTINSLSVEGETNLGSGIKEGTYILAKSSNTNKILVSLTDGGTTCGPNPPEMIENAKSAGIKTIAILTDDGEKQDVENADKIYEVSSADGSLFDVFVKDILGDIKESIPAKYNIYREESGSSSYDKIQEGVSNVEHKDNNATDKAGPIRPLVTLSDAVDDEGNIKMNVWSEDIGTIYELYVTYVNSKTGEELPSNRVTVEIKTGVAGYAWSITDNKDDDPGNEIKELQTLFPKEYVGKWLHIKAIDHAGNPGTRLDIKIERHRFITWEELNETKELFCVQHGQTIPAREDGKHLNALLVAGSGEYKISEVVTDPQEGDRIGTRYVEGTEFIDGALANIYGNQDIYTYSLGKYRVSPDTPAKRPGREGNATDVEAYILNYYKENNSLDSAVQKAMYSAEISKGNVTWNWEETPESEALLAAANAYASTVKRGYSFSNIKQDSSVYMDEDYKDILIGPFMLDYEPLGTMDEESSKYLARIIGMRVYDQNNEVIAELDTDGNNTGNIETEIVYADGDLPTKRYEEMFTRENYKYPVGYEKFYVKLKYKKELDDVTKINKIEFIHNRYIIDAQYEVLVGTYNKVRWEPNRVTSSSRDVLWCRDVENGFDVCVHGKDKAHIVGCYFYLTAHISESYRDIPSQKLINVIWVKHADENMVQTLEPDNSNKPDKPDQPDSPDNDKNKWKLVMDINGNVWDDGLEDNNNGIKENAEAGIEKVKVEIYQVDKTGSRTGVEYSTYTDTTGNYSIKNAKKGLYEIEFTYNGQKYISTKLLVNGSVTEYKNSPLLNKYKNNSVLQEKNQDRQDFNSLFEEIAGNKKAMDANGKTTAKLTYTEEMNASYIQTEDNGYPKPEFEMKSKSSANNIYYPLSEQITIDETRYIEITDSKNVNLGLAERRQTDSSLKTDLYETTFSIKGEKRKFIYSERNIRDINSNIEKDEYIQEVNKADYNWKLEDILSKAPNEEVKNRLLEIFSPEKKTEADAKENSELKVYADYMIVIRNSGEKDEVQIAELADYFSKNLEYDSSWAQVKYDDVKENYDRNKTDKIPIKWTTSSKYDNMNNPYDATYNKIYTTDLDRKDLRVRKGEFLEVHLVFKVTKPDGKISLDETGDGKVSMTEINGYKTYYIQDGSVAGLIDIDSQPGNANPTVGKEYREDDEDKAPALKLKLDSSANGEDGDSIGDDKNPDDINKDNDGNITGYGNVVEGNVWEDLKTTKNIIKLANNQIISDGIRQDGEPMIQNVKVDLVEYFKHPTDSSKDVYLTLKTQKTRAVLSLSNEAKLEGGYSFINLPSGNYKVRYTYGENEQLQENIKYNGQDYQGISSSDIANRDESNTTYEDVEIMLVTDVSGSMTESLEDVKNTANKLADGIYSRLPKVKLGLAKFNNNAEVVTKPSQASIKTAISKLNAGNETAIGRGLKSAQDIYSKDAKKKIMVVITDSEETVEAVEKVIKTLENVTDKSQIEVIAVLTKENDEIFGTEKEPRRGTVYQLYGTDKDTIIENVCQKIKESSMQENRRSNAKDIEGDASTPGTRAYGINKYQVVTIQEASKINSAEIAKIEDPEQKRKAIETLANETYMTAESKNVKFKPNNVKASVIHEINLALMQRPKTKLVMETEVETIKVVLSDNTVIIDTEKGLKQNVMGMDVPNATVSIYMDEEIMHGATLIVKYRIKIKNEGEIDSLSNYLTGADAGTVTTSAKLIFNYTSTNMLFKNEGLNTKMWDRIDIEDTKGYIKDEYQNDLKDKTIYETRDLDIALYPLGSKEVEEGTGKAEIDFNVTLSKLITSENDESDLTFNSSMDIVERGNTAGRVAEDNPGSYQPNSDIQGTGGAVKNRKIIITKPLGANKSTTYLLIAIAIGATTAITIAIIRKFRNKTQDK